MGLEKIRSDENLVFGSDAKRFIVLNLNSFFNDVRKYYTTVSAYMLKKFPFGDDVKCRNCIHIRYDLNNSIGKYFLTRFSCLSENIAEKGDENEIENFSFSK